jgi:ferredoxin
LIAIDSSHCTGCGTCALVCPHRVIEIGEGRAFLAAEERCIECGACQLNCHDAAISVTKGTGCLVAIAKEVWLRRRSKSGSGADDALIQPGCGCGGC